jgi:CzcA family heavy metal efflux pump
MNFATLVEHHRRSIIVITLALALAGIFSAFSLPVGLFPSVSFPRVVISLDAGDRPADQMTLLVTTPVEQAIRRVPGVLNVRSVSSRGSAQVSLDFGWGADMVSTTLQVESAIAQILPSLPQGTTFLVRRMDPTVFPIIAYGLTSDTVSPVALRDLAQYQLVPLLSAIHGVARVDVQGGAQEEIQVAVNPQRLDAYGLALSDVVNALNAANVLSAVGKLEDHYKLYLVLSDNTLKHIDDVRNVVVKSGAEGVVRVSDIGKVIAGTVPQWTVVDEDGKPAVLFQVYQQPNGNSVQIAKAVRQALQSFAMPTGVTLSNWYDQSVLVTQSAASVRDAILIGLVLAACVLFAFLRSWRVTSVAMLIVPATLATTILFLNFVGMSFNIMTLGGLAAAVGLVIDDVIVMIEHIARRAGVKKETEKASGSLTVLHAAWEFLPPLSGSSLATLIVFFPLGFLTGVTGAFFKALSLTMGSALVISYVYTALAVPVLAYLLIDFDRWQDPAATKGGRFERMHRWSLDRLFKKPWLVSVCLLPLLALGWIAYTNVGTGFMPSMDEGGFVIDYHTEPGTSLTETNRELKQVEAILKATSDVMTFSRRTGLGLGGDFAEPNQGDFFVRLKPTGNRRPIDLVMEDVRQKIELQAPGVNIELAQLMEDLIGDLTAVPQPIEIKLFADDPSKLIPAANKVAAAIGTIQGVVDVRNGVTLAGDAIDVRINPIEAAMESIDPNQVTSALNTYLGGTVATNIPETHKQIGVRVWMPPEMKQRDSQLPDLPIRATDGHMFPLERAATLKVDAGQPEITRDNLQRMVAVTARIESRDLGSTVTDVKKLLQQQGVVDSGVTFKLGGLYEQQQIAFAGMLKVFAAALVAELVLLLFLYESFWLPVIIISSSLLSTTAVFTGLWLSGVELNITAMMGMTMIIGISTEMAIFYVSEYTELAHKMPIRDALLEASRNRLRPILMTSFAAILTLLPLAFAIGPGSAMQQPLAIAIIAGLLLQLPLVLLAMPVLIGLTTPKKHAGTS